MCVCVCVYTNTILVLLLAIDVLVVPSIFLNRSPQKLHTQLREAYPSTATGAANPASRSDANIQEI